LLQTNRLGRIETVTDDFVTTADIAQALGYSRQRVDTIIRRAEDFPEPVLVVGGSRGVRLWRRDVAMKWFEKHPRRRYSKPIGSDGARG
jgi:predicted DNA-binding transcriptional regulator AlpA